MSAGAIVSLTFLTAFKTPKEPMEELGSGDREFQWHISRTFTHVRVLVIVSELDSLMDAS